LEAILSKTILQAKEGDAQARQWLSDRGWGKAPETIDVMIGRVDVVIDNLEELNSGDFEDTEVIAPDPVLYLPESKTV
jgi:hypothetical protein